MPIPEKKRPGIAKYKQIMHELQDKNAKALERMKQSGFVNPSSSISRQDALNYAVQFDKAVLYESTSQPGLLILALPSKKLVKLNDYITHHPDAFKTVEAGIQHLEKKNHCTIQLEPIPVAAGIKRIN
jgi:hypothetical protein